MATYGARVPLPGVGRLGLPVLVLLASLAACGPDEDARPAAAPDTGTAAAPAYAAPDGAPGFCSRLASGEELTRLPVSVGLLVTGTDVEARAQIGRVMRELRGVLADVREEGGHDGLATALDGLVRSLGSVVVGPLTDAVRGSVTTGLQQVGAQAQPVCGFPT